MVPLILKLKKNTHKEIAKAQDIIVDELFNCITGAVIHGGTAIWRCYQGARFSEDVDCYLPRDMDKIETFFFNLQKKGFLIKKKKISENSIYSTLTFNRVDVRFECVFKKTDFVLRDYETIDGNFIPINTLSSEQLVLEKINAFLKRYKVRDLYDIFFLLKFVKERERVLKRLTEFVKLYKEPVDTDDLKALLLDSIPLKTQKMLEYISYWCK